MEETSHLETMQIAIIKIKNDAYVTYNIFIILSNFLFRWSINLKITRKEINARKINLFILKKIIEGKIMAKLVKLRHTIFNIQKFFHFYQSVINVQTY